MSSERYFMPYPASQLPEPDPADKLLCFELAGSLFSSWGDYWSDVVAIDEHTAQMRLMLWVLQRAVESGAPVYCESVVSATFSGKITDDLVPKAYRLWIPLREIGAAAYTSYAATAVPDDMVTAQMMAEKPKRRRIVNDPPPHRLSHEHIKTRNDLVRHVRLYFEGRPPVYTHIDFDIEESPNHILQVFSAAELFQRVTTLNKHESWNAAPAQCNLANYTTMSDYGPVFTPPEVVINSGLIRRMTTGPAGFLPSALSLLAYTLPTRLPPKHVLIEKLRSVLSSSGVTFNESWCHLDVLDLIGIGASEGVFTDPVFFSQMKAERKREWSDSAIDNILHAVYNTAFRIKRAFSRRLADAPTLDDKMRVYRILTAESTSVLSCKIHEIPTVYRSLHLEASELRGQMEEAERGSVGYLALRMCKFKGRKGYTKFATLWCSLCAGVESALRLMERQSVLWACLYARHFSVTHNECNNHGYFILAGPPDVGKSMAASAFLSSIATGLQTTSDGASKLAHTSDDRDSDLRCEFQDELKSLLSASGNDEASSAHTKSMQTLIQTGVFTYKRLGQDPLTHEWKTETTQKAERKMVVTCTNGLGNVPPAIQSRATIVPVARSEKKGTVGANMRVAVQDSDQYKILRPAFLMRTQLLSALQGEFWSLEAFGGLRICTSLFTVFQMLLDTHFGRNHLTPRRTADIKGCAIALMVQDLVNRWHFQGCGAKHSFNQDARSAFYSANAWLRAEHIIAAFGFLHGSTTMAGETVKVKQGISKLIECDDGISPTVTSDNNWFKLGCSKNALKSELARQCSDLGPGLVNAILSQFEKQTSALRFETANKQDIVYVGVEFMSDAMTEVETAIIESLKEVKSSAALSWDEQAYIFPASVRETFFNLELTTSMVPERLDNFPVRTVKQALRFLMLKKNPDGAPLFNTMDEAVGCNLSSECSVTSEVCATYPEMYKTKKNFIAPLVVQKSVLDQQTEEGSGVYEQLFRDFLAVSNPDYIGNRVMIAPGGKTIEVAPRVVNFKMTNPLYVPYGAPDAMLDVEDQDELLEDKLFERHAKTIHLTQNSCLEKQVMSRHAPWYTIA